ncbi:MAG: hypothetical protein HY998_08845 [candidate division NC10 bacterium]|nr:hypothetical protein [candidate division NC10 bacterium]
MGRTILPFSQVVQQEYEGWAKYRRALRREDREAFDSLFGKAKLHVAEAAYASRVSAMEPIFMSMLLELYKAVSRLDRRIEALEREISSRPRESPEASPLETKPDASHELQAEGR